MVGGTEQDGEPTMPQLALPVDVQDTDEVRTYRMTLPFLPPSKNVINGWPPAWQHSAKKKWLRHIKEQAAMLQMPLGVQKVGLSATLVFPTKARRDLSNYAQCLWHWFPDGLVQAGVLVDDSDGHIQYGPNLGVKFAFDTRDIPKPHRQRTVVSVTMRIGDGHE